MRTSLIAGLTFAGTGSTDQARARWRRRVSTCREGRILEERDLVPVAVPDRQATRREAFGFLDERESFCAQPARVEIEVGDCERHQAVTCALAVAHDVDRAAGGQPPNGLLVMREHVGGPTEQGFVPAVGSGEVCDGESGEHVRDRHSARFSL